MKLKPAFLFVLSLLSACGGGGGGGSGETTTPSSTPMQITSLSATSSLPFVSLKITTSGGTTTDPVTVTYSSSKGFSASSTAISVSSGTVVTSVPLYIDPATNRSGTGNVSVVLSQNGQNSASVPLTIRDLPPISTYGTTLGQITQAYITFEHLMLGHAINQMQTMRQSLATDTDAATKLQNAAFSLYTNLIPASIRSGIEVDKIIANGNSAFSWGMLNGRAIQFDAKQLDFMDRVIGVHLLQVFANPTGTASTTAHVASVSPTATSTNSMPDIIKAITSTATALSFANSVRHAGENKLADVLAAANVLKMAAKSQGAKDFEDTVGLATLFPKFALATSTMLNSIIPAAECLGGSAACDNPSDLASIVQKNGINVAIADYNAVAGSTWAAGFLDDGIKKASDSYFSSISVFQAIQNGDIGNLWNAAAAAVKSATYTAAATALGAVSGTAKVTYPVGMPSRLPGIQLQQCTGATCTSNFNITGVSDSTGSYQLIVPLKIPGTDYAHMNMVAFDYVSGSGVASSVVDLTGLDATRPVKIPGALSGSYTSPTSYKLLFGTAGSGTGSISLSRSGTSCGTGCYSYPTGTSIQLTATPASGSLFSGWTGACVGTGSCSITLSTNLTVAAKFSAIDPNAHWYYHWNCNGDSTCLATNSAGKPSGTLDEGAGSGGLAACNSLLNFASHFWGTAATNSCDQSPT